VTVKGVAAKDQGNDIWTVRLNENVDSFTLTDSEVLTAYTPGSTSPASLITNVLVGYSNSEWTYAASIDVARAQAANILTVVVRDANGTELASYPNGGLDRPYSYRFYGLVEPVQGTDPQEALANAQLLEGKAVTVTVTTATGSDIAETTYAWGND
jgi:hypothetical protein